MNMPVPPVTSPSPPAPDAPARGADAGAADTPAFSNVLSQQRDGAAVRPAESRQTESRRAGKADAEASERRDPLGPDETLALILDSAALPLMQAAAAATDPHAARVGSAARQGADGPQADRLPIDLAGRAPADALGATLDSDTNEETDAGIRIRMPRADAVAATSSAAREPLSAPATDPASQRESGRTRTSTVSFQHQAPDQARTLPYAAEDQAAAPAFRIRSAAGAEAVQPATPDAALSSVGAPAGASLLPAATPAPAAAPVAVSTPLSSPQWPQDFSRQVLQLTQNIAGSGHTVQMHLNPPELGPIHITLHVGDSIAQASFVSPHASVRHALENALPHLEQQLAQAGLSLGQADVGDQQPGQQAHTQGQASPARDGGAVFSLDGGTVETAALQAAPAASRTISRPDALVDTFA